MSRSLFPMTIICANMNVISWVGELKRFGIIFCISWIPPSCLWPCLWSRLRILTLSDSSTLARATFSVSFIPSSSSRQVKHWLDVLGIFSRLRFLNFVCCPRLCVLSYQVKEDDWLARRAGRKGLNIKWCFLTFTQFSLDVEAKNNLTLDQNNTAFVLFTAEGSKRKLLKNIPFKFFAFPINNFTWNQIVY